MICVLETIGLKDWQQGAVGSRYVWDLTEWAKCENNCPCVINKGGCQKRLSTTRRIAWLILWEYNSVSSLSCGIHCALCKKWPWWQRCMGSKTQANCHSLSDGSKAEKNTKPPFPRGIRQSCSGGFLTLESFHHENAEIFSLWKTTILKMDLSCLFIMLL